MNEDIDPAIYQTRLVEIFQSCDSGSKGFLSVLEFEELCQQLHLGHQKDRLLEEVKLKITATDTKVYFEDFKSALLSLLEEVDPETLASGDLGSLSSSETERHETKEKWYQDHSLSCTDHHKHSSAEVTVSRSTDEQSQSNAASLSPASIKRTFVEDVEQQNQNGNQERHNSSRMETFETEGQPTATPLQVGRHALDSGFRLQQLQDVCSRLGVEQYGYLTCKELGQVCHFISMDEPKDEELQRLFCRLDVDHDGYVSFDEFLEEFSHRIIFNARTFKSPPAQTSPVSWLSARKIQSPLSRAQGRQSPTLHASGSILNIFSSLESSSAGFARGEEIVDFWGQLNIPNGADILMNLGFDPQSKISLKELSIVLMTEWPGPIAETNSLGKVLTVTYQQELLYLRSELDHIIEERNKLRADLTDALFQNAVMAAEMDERYEHLEKSYEARLQSLEQEHHNQLRHTQVELESECEAHQALAVQLQQTSEQFQQLKHEMTDLRDELHKAESTKSAVLQELGQLREKESEWTDKYNKLKNELQQQQQQDSQGISSRGSWEMEKEILSKTVEQRAAENKELTDRNDELLAQVEELHQQLLPLQHQISLDGQNHSPSKPQFPLQMFASSVSSDASEWGEDDDLLSSTEGFFFGQHNLPAAVEENDKVPLSIELKQQQRLKRGERRERERKEMEHSFRLEIAELEDRHEVEKQHFLRNLEKEKVRMSEELQNKLAQRLAEQQRELQNAFAMEKQDLLEQYESRRNLAQIQHQQELQILAEKLQKDEKQQKTDPIQNIATNLQARNHMQELEKAKAEQNQLKAQYETELQNLKQKHAENVSILKATSEERVQAAMRKMFEEGVGGLEGKLQEDFHHLLQQNYDAAVKQNKLNLMQRYESQIRELQGEIGSLRNDLNAERAAFEQLQLSYTASQEMEESQLREELQETEIEEVGPLCLENPQQDSENQSPVEELQAQIIQLQGQLQDAYVDQQQFQLLQNECTFLRQTNNGLDSMLHVLREQFGKDVIDGEGEEQQQKFWEVKQQLQNILQNATDKLLRASTQMAKAQTKLVHEVEQLREKTGSMVELETFTGLQLSLLKMQHHAKCLQEVIMQRTYLTDKVIAEMIREHHEERNLCKRQKHEMQSRLESTTEMYRNLAQQHKALRQSATHLAVQMKDLYVENADLMRVIQQVEAKQITEQHKKLKLQQQCQKHHQSSKQERRSSQTTNITTPSNI